MASASSEQRLARRARALRFVQERVIERQALGCNALAGGEHGSTRLVHVSAVAKATFAEQRAQLDERLGQADGLGMCQAECFDAW